LRFFFKEEKSYWYLNKLPSRKINAVKCTIYFNFIAYKPEFYAKKAKAGWGAPHVCGYVKSPECI